VTLIRRPSYPSHPDGIVVVVYDGMGMGDSKTLEKASKSEGKFQIAQDDRYRTLVEHVLDPKYGLTL